MRNIFWPINDNKILNDRFWDTAQKENDNIDTLCVTINRDNFGISQSFIPTNNNDDVVDYRHDKPESVNHYEYRWDIDYCIFEFRMFRSNSKLSFININLPIEAHIIIEDILINV